MLFIWKLRMWMMKINPNQFNKRVEFGFLNEDDYDANGQVVSSFKPVFKRWFGYRQQTLNQQYNLEGLGIKNTILIAIRHCKEIQEGMYCQIDNKLYRILTISSDERTGNGLNAFDVLTIQLVKKRGV